MTKRKSERVFSPVILTTKEELMTALDEGKIKSAKYNLLSDEEKMFVQLLAFGGYTPSQAIRQIHPEFRDAWAAGKRWVARGVVAEALEELTFKRDKYWMNRVSSSADNALRTLDYIMATTKDEALKATVAKTIVELAHKNETLRQKKDDKIGGFRMVIHVPTEPTPYDPDAVIDAEIIEDEEDHEPVMTLAYAETSKEISE